MVFIFSCNPQKKIIKEPIKEKGAEFLFQQLKKNEFKFNWLTIKFSANVTFNKTENSFSGTLRMRKDSAIWISISPALGIEAARIFITPDSVKMLNRLQNTFFEGDLKFISNTLNTYFDFEMLQSLLIGNDIAVYKNEVYKASIDGKLYLLNTIGRIKLKKHLKNVTDSLNLLKQDIWLNPYNYKITKVHLKELKENRKLEANYNEFTKVDSLLFPSVVEYKTTNEKDKLEIKIEHSKISSAGPLEFPFNVSNKYKKIVNF
ncbi:MAG: DUF4292 domain-containing protein [Bacteroidetes bacterium]|nr:DUF4292 domain-containing protein [Bacteroidota bacterium]